MDSPLEPSNTSPVGDGGGSSSGGSAEPAAAAAAADAEPPLPSADVLDGDDDDMPPLPPLPGQALPEPADTPQSANQRRRCAVEGCDKQSQGGRNRNMCRTHYREWYQANHPDGGASAGSDNAGGRSSAGSAEYAVAADGSTVPTEPAKSSRPYSDPVRPRCSVAGCDKQSQGKRCNGMCQRHYSEMGMAYSGAHRPVSSITVSSASGAMAMAAATMADMNMDAMSVSTLGTAASSTTPPPGSGAQQRHNYQPPQRKKPLCSVKGCVKQSQGGRKNHMCAAHFKEKFGPAGAGSAAGAAGAGPIRRRRGNARSRYNDRSSTHPLCAINRCPKQSQGGRCNFMCASHFKQYGYEPPPQDSEDDDDMSEEDDEEEDNWEAEADADDDEVKTGPGRVGRHGDAYERNNGYYAPMSPEYNNPTNFAVEQMDVDDTMPPLPSTNQSLPPIPPIPPVPPIPPIAPAAEATAEMPPLVVAEVAADGQRNGDPFAFEQTSGANVTASPKRPVPPASPRRYASPGRVQDDHLLSPSQRRKRRLDKHIDHAKKVAASSAAPVVKVAEAASMPASAPEEEEKCGDIPKSSNELPPFAIQSKPPPSRIGYPNHKSLQKQSGEISSSFTTLGPSSDGSIHFLDTLGRCRIAANDQCGFQWFPRGSTWEDFIASEFIGYSKGLGRVYFRSFIHRGCKIEVGKFVRKRFGNTTEYYRIAGAFQATVSFLGNWEDGSFPTEGNQNPHKGEIQKRGHPYLIVVPLKLKSDIVSSKVQKKTKKARRKSNSAAHGGDTESALQGGQGEKELVLTKEEDIEPNNIFVLPMWIGEPGVTFETISVRCMSKQDNESDIKATDHGRSGEAKKCKRVEKEETYVCRRAINQSATFKQVNKKRRKAVNGSEIEAGGDDMLTKYLADEQFQLLTSNPKELLESFIPRQWAPRFDACRTQFIRSWEKRPWYDDASPNLDFYPNPNASSDDSDGFDEESSVILRDSIEHETESVDSAEEAAKVGQRVPVPDIGEGWTISETRRKSGATKGRRDKTWHSPCGRDFRSLVQVKKFKAEQLRQGSKSAPRKKS